MDKLTRQSLRRFGRFIVATRKKEGMTRAALIRQSGLALSVIQSIEQGASNPTFVTLKKLTTALNFQLCIHPGTPPKQASAAQMESWLRSPQALPASPKPTKSRADLHPMDLLMQSIP